MDPPRRRRNPAEAASGRDGHRSAKVTHSEALTDERSGAPDGTRPASGRPVSAYEVADVVLASARRVAGPTRAPGGRGAGGHPRRRLTFVVGHPIGLPDQLLDRSLESVRVPGGRVTLSRRSWASPCGFCDVPMDGSSAMSVSDEIDWAPTSTVAVRRGGRGPSTSPVRSLVLKLRVSAAAPQRLTPGYRHPRSRTGRGDWICHRTPTSS